jgi:hypothetical protein
MIVLIPFRSKQLEESILGTSNSALSQPAISAKAAAAIIDHKNYIAEKAAAGSDRPAVSEKTENVSIPITLRSPPPFCSLVNVEPADNSTLDNLSSAFKLPPFSAVVITLEFCYYCISDDTKLVEKPQTWNLSLGLDYLTVDNLNSPSEEKTTSKQSAFVRYYRK